MVIQCPKCKKQYKVESSRITESGVRITCPTCSHQFLVRKKAEEKEDKSEPKKAKAPACVICGQPSTHVLRGPPPKPVCEHHYTIEKEKETRFFESDPGLADAGAKAAAKAPDPGATRVENLPADPSKTRVESIQPEKTAVSHPEPPSEKKGTKSPAVSDPAFESFDDDFDFFDSEEAQAEAASPEPEEEKMPIADPHEFLEPGGGVAEANIDSEPPPAPDPGGGDDFDQAPVPAEEAPAPPAPPPPPTPGAAPDPFAPDAPETSDDSFHPDAAEPGDTSEPSFITPEEGDDFLDRKRAATNLDGSPVEESFPDTDESQESFAWETGADSSESPAFTSLDEEVGAAMVGKAARRGKAPLPIADEALLRQKPKPANQRSLAVSLSVLVVLFLAVVSSAYVSSSGIIQGSGSTQPGIKFEELKWRGQLGGPVADESPVIPTSLISLDQLDGFKGGAKPAVSSDIAKKALGLMLKDTMSAYAQALAELDQAIALQPQEAELLALKIEALAFRESRDAAGKTFLKSGADFDALKSVDSDLQDHPLMTRAKAHVFLNDKKTAAARALLTNYLEKNPRDGTALYLMGLTYRYQPQPDLEQAVKYLDQAVKNEPGLIRAYWDLADMYREVGRYDDAIDMYNRVLTRSPEREGTAEAMENTLREKSLGSAKRPPATSDEGDITIVVKEEPLPEGIEVTGSAIPDNILEVIKEVEPQIRRLQLSTPSQPTTPVRRNLPRPPEEGPR